MVKLKSRRREEEKQKYIVGGVNMYYGDKREAKTNIMAELVNRGWKVFGYTPDKSDPMSDYYSPSHWDGIGTKNGYVLIIDNHNASYSGYEVKEYDYSQRKSVYKTSERIEKLTAMMNDAASTENEKASCATLIEKEQEKLGANTKPSYTVLETYPTFSYGNPKSCSWHIEFNNQIIAKGTGVFACYVGNDHIEENRIERDNKINAFIDRVEAAISQVDALESEVVKVAKTVIKPVETDVKVITESSLNNDLMFIMKVGYTGGNSKGTKFQLVYKAENSSYNTFAKLGKQLKPSKSMDNAWSLNLTKLNDMLSKGHIAIIELQEFIEWESKTVYKKTAKKQKEANYDVPALAEDVEEVVAEQEEEAQEATQAETVNNNNASDVHATLNINQEKNGIEIKFTNKPSKNVIEALKENGFRWFQPLGFWCAKQTPDRLKFAEMIVEAYNSIMQEEPEQSEDTEEQAEIIEESAQAEEVQASETVSPYDFKIDLNYLYHDVHFKVWNDSIETLSQLLDHKNINYYIAGEKFICEGLTVDDVAWIEVVNKDNGAIIFYDNKYNEKADNNNEENEQQETAEQDNETTTEPIIINGKIKVKEITFIWSESSMIKDNLTVSTFAEAEELIKNAAIYVNGGYDKTKFIITWTDGDTYTGRIDIEKEYADIKTPIKDHITDWLLFLTGDKKPSHMIVKAYEDTLKAYAIPEDEKQQFYNFLEKYALTDIEPNDNNSETTSEPDNIVYHDFAQKNEKEGEFNMFNDILSKFDNVEFTTESKIAADDLEFCQEQESIYRQTMNAYNSLNEQLQAIKPIADAHGQKYGEMNSNGMIYKKGTAFDAGFSFYDLDKNTNKIKERFISNTCYYFMKKYNVTIDYEKIQKKYDSNVTYENIVDEIFLQLGGYNFTEKATEEIKEKAKNAVRNSEKISIKNSKLILDGGFAYHDSIWKEYKLSGGFPELFKALQHFEDGTTNGNSELIGKYCGYNNERNEANYERYEPMTLNKVQSIKFLKNGKLEIEFKSNQNATKFAQEYCGYSQKSA